MIINYNIKIKDANLRTNINSDNTKPKSTLGQSNPTPLQVYFHGNHHPPETSSPETSTQTMEHECLSDGK